MQLYDRGIRRRLAPMLDGDRRRLELAYSLMFTLPGTPVIRYGDELGMGDDLRCPSATARARRCNGRPSRTAASPRRDKPLLPGDQRAALTAIEHVNAAEQRRDPNSLLNWTERIIRMRKEVPEIGWGDFAVLRVARPGRAGAALRLAQQLGRCSCTTSPREPREIAFDVGLDDDERRRAARTCWPTTTAGPATDGKHRLVLEGYGYRWYRVGGLDYLLKRSEI